MNKESGKTCKVSLNCKITKGEVTGVYIGQIEEFPGITAYGKTEDELVTNINESIDAYFDAFPEEIKVYEKIAKTESGKEVKKMKVEVCC